MNICIIIPAYNEDAQIGKVVRDVLSLTLPSSSVIVVDDGSSDATAQRAEKAGALVLRHDINLGKGAAMKTGCDAAVMLGAEIIITIDGDGQHKAEDILKALESFEQTSAEIVFGARPINKSMPFTQRIGNTFFTALITRLLSVSLLDTQTGFRLMTREAYESVMWHQNDYAVETEIIARMSKKKIPYTEIMIDTIYIDNYKGTTPLDGVKILSKLIAFKLFL